MTIFDLSPSGLASDPRLRGRPPVAAPVNIEADLQLVPHAVLSPIGPGSGSLDKERWGGTDRNYNETVKKFEPVPELVSQPLRLGADRDIFLLHGVLGPTFTTEVAFGQWLAEAEEQLNACTSCAEEEDLLPPSETALAKSRALLQQLSANIKSQPDIYPMDEASVAIDFRTSDGRSGVLFVIDRDGSGVMFHSREGVRGRTRVDDALQLIGEDAIAKLRLVGVR